MGALLPAGIRAHVRPVSLLVSPLLVTVIARASPQRGLALCLIGRLQQSDMITRGRRTASSVAEFRGPSPHDLGTAELATVQVLEKNIEVMLHLLDDWHRPMGPVVRVQMTADVARALAERLTNAAAQAEPGE